jgi:hypothetical protein
MLIFFYYTNYTYMSSGIDDKRDRSERSRRPLEIMRVLSRHIGASRGDDQLAVTILDVQPFTS